MFIFSFLAASCYRKKISDCHKNALSDSVGAAPSLPRYLRIIVFVIEQHNGWHCRLQKCRRICLTAVGLRVHCSLWKRRCLQNTDFEQFLTSCPSVHAVTNQNCFQNRLIQRFKFYCILMNLSSFLLARCKFPH